MKTVSSRGVSHIFLDASGSRAHHCLAVGNATPLSLPSQSIIAHNDTTHFHSIQFLLHGQCLAENRKLQSEKIWRMRFHRDTFLCELIALSNPPGAGKLFNVHTGVPFVYVRVISHDSLVPLSEDSAEALYVSSSWRRHRLLGVLLHNRLCLLARWQQTKQNQPLMKGWTQVTSQSRTDNLESRTYSSISSTFPPSLLPPLKREKWKEKKRQSTCD